MPQPTIPVPPYPNVPLAPGVPPLLRSAIGGVNTFRGPIVGVLDAKTNSFTGSVSGVLTRATGQVGAIVGTVRGTIDLANNVSAFLSGDVGGRLLGAITGTVDRVTGVIKGTLGAQLSQLSGSLSFLTGNSTALGAQAEVFQWGLFDKDGGPAVVGTNVVGVDYSSEYRIADYPVEGSVFQSFNKVQVPFDLRMTFTKGGTLAERTAFLNDAEKALASLDFFTALTPEWVYDPVNVVHVGYARTVKNGATLLTVDVGMRRVRNTAQTKFSNTQSDNGAADVNGGSVQTSTPTTGQAAAISSQLEGPPTGSFIDG